MNVSNKIFNSQVRRNVFYSTIRMGIYIYIVNNNFRASLEKCHFYDLFLKYFSCAIYRLRHENSQYATKHFEILDVINCAELTC